MLRDGHVQMEAGPESCFLMSRNVWNTDVEELGKPSREGMCSSLVFQTFSLEESEKKNLRNLSVGSGSAAGVTVRWGKVIKEIGSTFVSLADF